VQEALALRQVGVSAAILNFDDLVPEFRANNPGVDLSIFSVHNARDVASFLSDKARKFDAVICTLYASTHWLPTFNIGPNLGYYIQDYEPFFFETGSRDFRLANASYVTRADLRLFCKTEWVAKKVQQLSNSSPQVIGPSVNLALFSPNSSRAIGEPIHIAAMLRPSTPRRAAMRTAGVLVQISKRYGSRVRITTFGASSEQLTDYGIVLPTEIENVGYIKPDGMALLLSSCHIFVDASDFQAMGLTALEAMASGCAVVVPMDGGCKEFATHLENAILVNTGDPQQVEQAIAHLIDDQELLRRIQRNAVMSVAGLGPLGAACRLAEFMLDGKHEN
jgi:glycosyltransferase involved in cell wall biosynthesis